MGNAVSPCLGICTRDSKASQVIKLVFWGGSTRLLPAVAGKHVAGDILFEFPDRLLCAADAFFIGHRIPALSISDELCPGNTYFIIPADLFPCETLTAAALAKFSPSRNSPINSGDRTAALQHVKGTDGRLLIKVSPEYITNAILTRGGAGAGCNEGSSSLCSTPELRKHYVELVGSARDRPWSPKLETISEKNGRLLTMSPARLLGLERIVK